MEHVKKGKIKSDDDNLREQKINGDSILHSRITKSYGYKGWAQKLNLKTKEQVLREELSKRKERSKIKEEKEARTKEECSQLIEKGVTETQNKLDIDRMPTRTELEEIDFIWLSNLIRRNGGFIEWANRLGLERKQKPTSKKKSIRKKPKLDIQDRIENSIYEAQRELLISRMPTSSELRKSRFSWLESVISKHGGFVYWADHLNLDRKFTQEKRMDSKEIVSSVKQIVNTLELDRMPSTSEIKTFEFGSRLHNSIVRSYGYREWANKLGLKLKKSETQLGNDYERVVISTLESKGYCTDKMTTNHPFDLLVNNSVKIDVKVAKPHISKDESRVHTFSTNKRYGSCDLYIAVALDEKGQIERFLIIPSHRLQIVTLCIGKESKYDIYNNRYDILDNYIWFHDSIK